MSRGLDSELSCHGRAIRPDAACLQVALALLALLSVSQTGSGNDVDALPLALQPAPASAAAPKCPCANCPPKGASGACCHGNLTCETTNWTPETCTPAYGTWCAGTGPPSPPSPSPSPSPSPPSPAPSPAVPRPPPLPSGTQRLLVNYVIGLANVASGSKLEPVAGPLGGSTHVILSFLEPSTPTIPGPTDQAWVKYAAAEFAGLAPSARAAFKASLAQQSVKLMASLGGAAATHGVYSKYEPAARRA